MSLRPIFRVRLTVKAHPMCNRSAGTLKTVSNITLKDIKNTHTKNYGANNAALVAIGDVSLSQIQALANTHLSGFKQASPPMTTMANPQKELKEMQTRLVERPASPQTYIIIGQPVATQKIPDLPRLEVLEKPPCWLAHQQAQ